jgi:hypothetical protein
MRHPQRRNPLRVIPREFINHFLKGKCAVVRLGAIARLAPAAARKDFDCG